MLVGGEPTTPSTVDVLVMSSSVRCLTRLKLAEQPQFVSGVPEKLALLAALPAHTSCSSVRVVELSVTVVPAASSVTVGRLTNVSTTLSWLSMVVVPSILSPPELFQ